MPGESKIEWTDATWNPVTGCTKVSAGCDHCYAETFAERWRGVPGHPYEQGFDLKLWPQRLDIPLRWTKPRRVFVNSMSDLFHADVPDAFVEQIFAVMSLCPDHTFQVLTKRPKRMARLIASESFVEGVEVERDRILTDSEWKTGRLHRREPLAESWPLRNVWLGTSVENQEVAWRIDWLVKTPAAVRFLSCEPLIGPLDIDKWLWRRTGEWRWGEDGFLPVAEPAGDLHWVIAGGESGHGARPCEPHWLGMLAIQSRYARVPFFAKQLGAVWAREHKADPKGGNWDLWPADLRVREFPAIQVTT